MIERSACCFLRLLKDSFDRSCSDVVGRVCWTKDRVERTLELIMHIEGGSVCILCMR